MGGRKPKPTAMKILEGNPGKRKLPEFEPKFDLSDVSIPEPLKCVEWALAASEWARMVEVFKPAGILTDADKTALLAYCMTFQRWLEAEEHVRKNGMVVLDGDSYRINPYVSIIHKSLEQIKAFMSDFGMTPSSRVRLVGSPKSDKDLDPLLEFVHDAKSRK